MFKEFLNLEEIEDTIKETSSESGFHPIVAFYEYDEIDNNIETNEYNDNSNYCFPIIFSTQIEDI